MLRWAFFFFLVILISVWVGFGGAWDPASEALGRPLFFLSLAFFLITLVAGLARRRHGRLRELR